MRHRCVLLLVPLLCASCADSVTEPSPPSPPIPSVAGQYAGIINSNYWGPVTTSITQSGTTVTIEPLQVSHTTCPFSIPFGETTIDEAGSFGKKWGTFSQCHCLFHYTATGGFVERDLRITMDVTSTSPLDEYDFPVDGCFNKRPVITLSRQ